MLAAVGVAECCKQAAAAHVLALNLTAWSLVKLSKSHRILHRIVLAFEREPDSSLDGSFDRTLESMHEGLVAMAGVEFHPVSSFEPHLVLVHGEAPFEEP